MDLHCSKIIYLSIHQWETRLYKDGHYYGDLQRGTASDKIQLTHQLNKQEAALLNKQDYGLGCTLTEDVLQDFGGGYQIGEDSCRFFSKDELYVCAIDTYRKSYPDAILLIKGNLWSLSPQLVLVGPPDTVRELNKLFSEYNEENKLWEQWLSIIRNL